MKNRLLRVFCALFTALIVITALSVAAYAEEPVSGSEEAAESTGGTGAKATAAAVAVGIAAAAGALGMGIAIAKSTESMARQPEASDRINSAMMLGLVFIETTVIYALIVAILVIFVL